MVLFLLTYFTIYSLLHLYIFAKIRSAFNLSTLIAACLICFMVLMICAPVLVRISEKHGLDLAGRLLSQVGYTWMGLAFLLFAFSVPIDLYRLLMHGSGFIAHRDLSSFIPPPRMALLLPLLISTAIMVYGSFEARTIRTERVTIRTSKIPPQIGKRTIVQISDVHLGLIVRGGRLTRILKEVRRANPDILVSTGDLVDGQIDSLTGLAELFQSINPPYGKFAVTGNHEFYAGLDHALSFTEEAGFTMLRGEAVRVGGFITIAGVDDPAGKLMGLYRDVSEQKLLADASPDTFTILLKHRPFVTGDIFGLFDLQLSGHTHKGQIFPFSLITRLYFPAHAGIFELSDGAHLYVSRGTGTWGPPVRFLSPPEVTVIELVHEEGK